MYKSEFPADTMARLRRTNLMNSDHLQNETPADRDVKTIHSLEQQLAVQHERCLRLAADFDNYKKRMAREMDRRAASQKEAWYAICYPRLTISNGLSPQRCLRVKAFIWVRR